ncbi:MAG: ABC transporter permease [Betaproteobacteria bacterium HGW-Betaproteobacteria-5]|jgi:lipopolysaccharide transport system permease protein|nr:MAG: ABC transporter permease [Betaproteobacteria bacterium HGW-Betaproteobacteria-5]PKO30666.1 MAG: ABC transporter permease [Betaproteobacteria bacterium HGW-Betaproteobacteria-7]
MIFGFDRQDVRLAINLFRMNIRDRYLGSTLGSLWAVANPLFMLALYTYVFGFVFKVRLPGAETTLGYVLWLISGYGPWIATTEALLAAAGSVVGAAGIVKNMAFKTELLPLSAVFVGLINLLVSMTFLLLLLILSGGQVGWTIILLPIVIAIHFFFLAGVGLWLGAITVFVRDLMQALPNLLTIMLFASPIFYSMESLPAIVQNISFVNPFFQISDAYRKIILEEQMPAVWGMLYLMLLSLIVFWSGMISFRRVKGYFDSAL